MAAAATATTLCSVAAATRSASTLNASSRPPSARLLPSGCCNSSSSSSSNSSARNGISGGHGSLSFSSEAAAAAGAERRWKQLNNHHVGCGNGSIRAATVAAVATDAPPSSSSSSTSIPRLKKIYLEKVVPAMKEEFKYQSSQEIPYLKKIVVNCGVGEAAQNAKALESTVRDLAVVTGQKPLTTRAKKAIAGFKLREGVPVGVCLTLRGEVMYSFLDRLVNLALPRTRDFQGVNPYSFDGKGNYTLGVPEQSVFPEIRFENIDRQRGMDVNIVSTAKNDTEGQKLLSLLGMPFKEGTSARSAASGKKKAKDQFIGRKRTKVPKRKK